MRAQNKALLHAASELVRDKWQTFYVVSTLLFLDFTSLYAYDLRILSLTWDCTAEVIYLLKE
jgi:hypothetical protein